MSSLHESLGTLILEITQACNLHCSYCYRHWEGHSSSHSRHTGMSTDTALRVIDFYHEHCRRAPGPHNIQFYGGEPLLEFDILQETIAYARKRFSHTSPPRFTISTNGVLLNEEVRNFFSESPDLHLCVTLDGPKAYHDRARHSPEGKGTHDTILANLRALQRRSPLGYKERVTFLATFDEVEALAAIDRFYQSTDVLSEKTPDVSPIAIPATYVEPDEACKRVRDLHAHLRAVYVAGANTSERVSPMIARLASRVLARFVRRSAAPWERATFSGTCMPLVRKLFVRRDGSFNICEKVPAVMAFGTAVRGFDYARISQLLDAFESRFAQKCRHCPAVRLCDVCFDEHLVSATSQGQPGSLFCDVARTKVEEGLRLFVDLHEIGAL